MLHINQYVLHYNRIPIYKVFLCVTFSIVSLSRKIKIFWRCLFEKTKLFTNFDFRSFSHVKFIINSVWRYVCHIILVCFFGVNLSTETKTIRLFYVYQKKKHLQRIHVSEKYRMSMVREITPTEIGLLMSVGKDFCHVKNTEQILIFIIVKC